MTTNDAPEMARLRAELEETRDHLATVRADHLACRELLADTESKLAAERAARERLEILVAKWALRAGLWHGRYEKLATEKGK